MTAEQIAPNLTYVQIGDYDIPEGDYAFLFVENLKSYHEYSWLYEALFGLGYRRYYLCGFYGNSWYWEMSRAGKDDGVHMEVRSEDEVQKILEICLSPSVSGIRCTFLADDKEEARAFLRTVKENSKKEDSLSHRLTRGFEFHFRGEDGVISLCGDAVILWKGKEYRYETAREALEADIFRLGCFLDVAGKVQEYPGKRRDET